MQLIDYTDQNLPPVEGYDLIGDVHGCGATLERLLQKLGYSKIQNVYQHPRRRVIFLGDIIDRGPRIREALLLAHSMVQKGSALMVLGNHEFNAITYCTRVRGNIVRPGEEETVEYLRPHTPGYTRQIAETLEQFAHYPEEWNELIEWFKTQPLFMELGDASAGNRFRVVHACWDNELIAAHRARFGDGHFDEDFIHESAEPNSLSAKTKQRLISGVALPLPQGMSLVSSDGYERNSFRTKFWSPRAQTYGELLFQPDPLPKAIAKEPISKDHRSQMVNYSPEEPPLFIGHYWLRGQPKPITNNVACLDYSAVKYGRLVAYRMNGEQQLNAKNFVWVYVDP
ncbi:MAG TPA: metallophosphoesterase [Cellvibrio sp.]|nr:metallophosphoesterase [Cellvibrio sp.]